MTGLGEDGRWSGRLPIGFRYTAGLAGERFYRALAEAGVFLASPCAACGVVYCPPASFCERCFAALDPADDVEVGPGGVIETCTVARIGLDGLPLDPPVPVAVVRLDGATTTLVHRLLINPSTSLPPIGCRVVAVVGDPAGRRGSLLDVKGFQVLDP